MLDFILLTLIVLAHIETLYVHEKLTDQIIELLNKVSKLENDGPQ